MSAEAWCIQRATRHFLPSNGGRVWFAIEAYAPTEKDHPLRGTWHYAISMRRVLSEDFLEKRSVTRTALRKTFAECDALRKMWEREMEARHAA